MAFTQFTDGTTIQFGFNDANASSLAAAIGLRPQTLSITAEPEFNAEAKNEDGETVNVVVGPDKYNFTMSGFLENPSLFGEAKSFTFQADGVNRLFIVMNRKTDKSNVDFQKAEITGQAYLNVDTVVS